MSDTKYDKTSNLYKSKRHKSLNLCHEFGLHQERKDLNDSLEKIHSELHTYKSSFESYQIKQNLDRNYTTPIDLI